MEELQDREREILELNKAIEYLRKNQNDMLPGLITPEERKAFELCRKMNKQIEDLTDRLREKDKLIETLKEEMAKLEDDYVALRQSFDGPVLTQEQFSDRVRAVIQEKEALSRKLSYAEGTIEVIKSALKRGCFI